ncbi:MAG: translation initiation factor IF-2 [Bacteroidaceae bacterium]
MSIRLNKVIKEFNVGQQTIVEYLHKKGFEIESNPNAKLSDEQFNLVKSEFGTDKNLRSEAEKLIQGRQNKEKKGSISLKTEDMIKTEIPEDSRPKFKTVGRIDLDAPAKPAAPQPTLVSTPSPEPVSAPEPVPVSASTPVPEPVSAPEPVPAPTPVPMQSEAKKVEAKKEKEESMKMLVEEKTEAVSKETQPEVAVSEPKDEKAEAQVYKAKESKSKGPKPQTTVEERTAAVGSENDGVFTLHQPTELSAPKILGTIDLNSINQTTRPKKKTKEEKKKEREEKNRTAHPNATAADGQKKKRTRINKEKVDVSAASNQQGNTANGAPRTGTGAPRTGAPRTGTGAPRTGAGANNNTNGQRPHHFTGNRPNQTSGAGGNNANRSRRPGSPLPQPQKAEVSDEDVAKQVKETLARLTSKGKNGKGAKYRKEKRDNARIKEVRLNEEAAEDRTLKITEFVTANELASMMDLPVTRVIGTCMSIGMMVSINQRLDAETINLVAEEFGYKTEYVSADVAEAVTEEIDNEEDLLPRAPIVTVMGHVDHGKTSLLDYVRKANVIAGEAGGITQHIGAYNVTLEDGRQITFLDTPGHEAFTAMRARGAQATDIAIIIIAADDDIMPQTKEAINHAMAANVPIVFAINKIDKPTANPDKIKEGLAQMNFLIEEWGGKYQSQDISAKKGAGVKELLEKVLLEAEMLELKANPHRKATGTVIESSLDKGRGYVATVLVSNGTLNQGDIVLAGTNYGRVKALFNERNQRVDSIGPARAATLLGFNGAPQAGDTFHVMETEQEVRDIATKREQLQREQGIRTQKMLTLDEVGRRIALGGFQELNVIVKGDVDGSVEALSDSLIKLSTEKIVVNVIHKGVGQISENDVTLAAASEAIIIGFQVRPSIAARRQAEQQGVDIRLYSIIYDAIEEVKTAMEGMLEPVLKEEITSTIDVRQVYRITKVGTVAGAFVSDGKVKRSDKARLIRDGIVVFTGQIDALKRFKDDVKEVNVNFECGISLVNFNDIQEGDVIETFQEVEVKQKL